VTDTDIEYFWQGGTRQAWRDLFVRAVAETGDLVDAGWFVLVGQWTDLADTDSRLEAAGWHVIPPHRREWLRGFLGASYGPLRGWATAREGPAAAALIGAAWSQHDAPEELAVGLCASEPLANTLDDAKDRCRQSLAELRADLYQSWVQIILRTVPPSSPPAEALVERIRHAGEEVGVSMSRGSTAPDGWLRSLPWA
jgi:hypothetical protein